VGSAVITNFDALLERLVPGASTEAGLAIDAPPFPDGIGLEYRALIGRKAHGFVFRAFDPVLNRDVALKVARPSGDTDARRALLEEARWCAKLRHPAVLAVHGLREHPQLLCVQYDLPPVQTLADQLGSPEALICLPARERLRVLLPVVDAIARAHALEGIHGDLQPANIAIGTTGEPYVLDWGTLPSRSTNDPLLDGSPTHAAPEQLQGASATAASDVYTLGILAWELCLLRPLRPQIAGEGLASFVTRWKEKSLDLVPLVGIESQAICSLLEQALAPSPNTRPSASDLHSELAELLNGESARARRSDEARSHRQASKGAVIQLIALREKLQAEEQQLAVLHAEAIEDHSAAHRKKRWAAQDRVEQLRANENRVWFEALECAHRASALTPDLDDTLTKTLWTTPPVMIAPKNRADELGPDHMTATLSVAIRPGDETEDARVVIHRLRERRRRLEAEPLEEWGLPLEDFQLAPGRYLLTAVARGCTPSRLSLKIGPREYRSETIRLLKASQIGDGWRFIPGGVYVLGGDEGAPASNTLVEPYLHDLFMQTLPITCGEWLEFLNALALPEAKRHRPGDPGWRAIGGAWTWRHDGKEWVLPQGWKSNWPVTAISKDDASAYARWRSEREGRPCRLPTEEEWEKAARGGDGRTWPWGDRFDASFAHSASSAAGRSTPHKVGAFTGDSSVYGVQDLAGNVREWTSSTQRGGLSVVKGAAWIDTRECARGAARSFRPAGYRSGLIGFRLVSERPLPDTKRSRSS